MKVLLLSDTHGELSDDVLPYLADCNEVWHAGDIGSMQVMEQLAPCGVIRAVHGNIDGGMLRLNYPEHLFFQCEGLKVCIKHISGTPPRYNRPTRELIKQYQPDVLIGGHTHILQVERDHNRLLYLNPGAIGHYGIHPVRTLLQFEVKEGKIGQMQVVELGGRRY